MVEKYEVAVPLVIDASNFIVSGFFHEFERLLAALMQKRIIRWRLRHAGYRLWGITMMQCNLRAFEQTLNKYHLHLSDEQATELYKLVWQQLCISSGLSEQDAKEMYGEFNVQLVTARNKKFTIQIGFNQGGKNED